MMLKDYVHEPGKSCRTVAIRNLMFRNGLDLKEDTVFGLAEGLSFSFVIPDEKSEHKYFKCMAPNLNQFENFAKNMKFEYQVITETGKNFACMERILTGENDPVLCEVIPGKYKRYIHTDRQQWNELRMDIPLMSHVTEVIGMDERYVYICENYSKCTFRIPQKVFRKARNSNQDSYLNPHHKIHYFMVPEDLSTAVLREGIYRAITNNLTQYFGGKNERLGYQAFARFVHEYPQLYDRFGPAVCKKSLWITGSLMKYVSPGMFRKIYGRYLRECSGIIGQKDEFEEISKLFQQSDYLWNKFAGYILKKDIEVEERIKGRQGLALIEKISDVENQCMEKLMEVTASW